MKRCSMCGESYDDRVDFCFGDGTPLEMVLAQGVPAKVASSASASDFSGLDAPDPENLSGLDAPDPGGFAFEAPEPVSPEPVAEIPVAAAPVPVETPGQVEQSQDQASSEFPVGFFEPPSSGGESVLPVHPLGDPFG
jgi:hypothetical protein